MHELADEPVSTTEENSMCFMVLIVLSSLLAISLLVIVGLTVTLVLVKGKLAIGKGDNDSFNRPIGCMMLHWSAFLIEICSHLHWFCYFEKDNKTQ